MKLEVGGCLRKSGLTIQALFTSACSSSVSTNGHLLVTRQYICCYCLGTLGGGITLTGQDLFILTEILRPAAPQWKTVGLALEFPDYELATIEQKPLLIPEGPPGYFREMLSQWLKWAPPNHSLPTLESLAPALQSSGHEDLAVKLRTAFLQKKGRRTLNFDVSVLARKFDCAWCTNSCKTHHMH